jgi:hypothetical protein
MVEADSEDEEDADWDSGASVVSVIELVPKMRTQKINLN